MIENNQLLQRAALAPSTYASMAAFTAAAASAYHQSFYPPSSIQSDPVNYFPSQDWKRERLDSNVCVKLEDADLWKRFDSLGNEMIITKNGRRLFPNLRISISELNPDKKYMILLDIVPVDDHRYKYQETAWTVSGKAEPHISGRFYLHPDGSQTGAHWMKQIVVFNKVKITNNPMHDGNQILLNSMHRYILRVHIVEANDTYAIRTGPLSTFIFDETTFTAVTAYQNEKITKLKINNNPFAKGFRDSTHGKKNQTTSVKRLQSGVSMKKSSSMMKHSTHLCRNDSSLHSTTSSTSPLQVASAGPTSPDGTELEIVETIAAESPKYESTQFPSAQSHSFSPYPLYSGYTHDSSPMMFHPSYPYMSSSTNALPNNASPVPLHSYGYYPNLMYPTNAYSSPFF